MGNIRKGSEFVGKKFRLVARETRAVIGQGAGAWEAAPTPQHPVRELFQLNRKQAVFRDEGSTTPIYVNFDQLDPLVGEPGFFLVGMKSRTKYVAA